ncbi:hypothetical protein [Carnimonas nigrificans]|uniref:hypothetical protein n=1 Tax=Carnimonas nigrificans TaxID=64323 RepID=UPI000470DE34|nr:hypothetical protein [Carnimonas nigrificans]
MSALNDYWEALSRLSSNTPVRVPKSSPINKDTVALEAGRKRGSIKKSRTSFSELIKAIDDAADNINHSYQSNDNRLKAEKSAKNNYRELYHQTLNRELMLMERLVQLEKEIENLKKVVPLRK